MIVLLGLGDEFKHIPFTFDTDVNAPAVAEFTMHKLRAVAVVLTSQWALESG